MATMVERLREWAEATPKGEAEAIRSEDGKQWRVGLTLRGPVGFTGDTEWSDSIEDAAGMAIALLDTLGENTDPKKGS